MVDRPPSICKMTGICQLAKKLSNRGADIGDSRLLNQKQDMITSDILVGADYFTSFISSLPPTRVLSTYLMNTIFGQCIVGKISGSTRLMDSQTVNTLSISHVATNEMELQHLPGLLQTSEELDSFNGNEMISEFSSFSDIGINLYERKKMDSDALKHFKTTVKYH